MSTTHQLFTSEERDLFVKLLKEWPNSESGNTEATYSVTPYITFYFLPKEEENKEASALLVDIHEEFEHLAGYPYSIFMHGAAARPRRYDALHRPDLRKLARKTEPYEYFVFEFTDEENHASSPTTAGYFWRSKFKAADWKTAYSSIVFYYRWQWWLDNREAWRTFVLKTIDRLKADQVYSGFAMANPLEFGTRAAVTTWERALTPAFYGLDIDYPYGMDNELLNGIRPPTWAFLLADPWREKLDLTREQVHNALAHPRISITELQSGLWIELGEQPELYPAEYGVPELPMLLNKLLKPIRYDDLGLLGFGQWDGDPNERFTDADGRRWMGRFDADSDWPTPFMRVGALPTKTCTLPPAPACAVAGMPCLQAGVWRMVGQADSRRVFEQGDILPHLSNESDDGFVIWQRDPDQTPPEPARYANSHEPAPRAGRWELESDPCVSCELRVNDLLPLHADQIVRWRWLGFGLRVLSGSLCPYPGTWVCEYKTGSKRFFEYEAPMPTIDGEKVVWFWLAISPL
ncbi:type VI immunity family protein [Pseudomonas sp. 2835]|uniref:type VI immunity family protein n=1 Tax=Pseudomonas sp. 2835 TaxID=3156451 RepID=UPI003D2249B0